MNLKLTCLFVATAFVTASFSQTKTLTASDGTTANVNLVSTNPDEGKHASVYAGIFGPEGANIIGASYYKPKSIYLNVMAGPSSAMIDGSFFFINSLKKSTLRQSVRSGNTTRYIINEPLDKRKSFGLHAGTNYVNYSTFSINGANNFSTNGVFGGVTFLSSGHAHWKAGNDKETQGTTIGRLNADVIYYTNRKLFAAEEGKEQPALNDATRNIGFRIYFDGKTSAWSKKGRTAIHFIVGIGRNSDKARSFAPFGGLGVGYNFF